MKTGITIFLIICLLLQSFSRLVIMANYQLNKDFISKALCINRAKPAMSCHGKCYLAKQLKQAEKHEKSPAGNAKSKAEWLLFTQTLAVFTFDKPIVLLKCFSHYTYQPYTSPVYTIFHPPQFV